MGPLALLLANIGLGLLLAMLGIPMWLRKVPPNGVYGFRTPRTMADPEVWYEVNAIGGKVLMWGGLLMALFAPVALLLPGTIGITAALLLLCLGPPLPVVGALWCSSVYMARHEGYLTDKEPSKAPLERETGSIGDEASSQQRERERA